MRRATLIGAMLMFGLVSTVQAQQAFLVNAPEAREEQPAPKILLPPGPDSVPHTWRDGEQTRTVYLLADHVLRSNENFLLHGGERVLRSQTSTVVRTSRSREDGLTSVASAATVVTGPGGLSRVEELPSDQPVFVSGVGEIMTLPGGVILVFESYLHQDEIDQILDENGIDRSLVTPMALRNTYHVETDPGTVSLDTANRFLGMRHLQSSSPNWQRELVSQ